MYYWVPSQYLFQAGTNMLVLLCLLHPTSLCKCSEGQVYLAHYIDEEVEAQEAHSVTTAEEPCR